MRYKTGQIASVAGKYAFDGYIRAPAGTPQPTANEKEIPMDVGDTFPPINSTDQGAYWRKV